MNTILFLLSLKKLTCTGSLFVNIYVKTRLYFKNSDNDHVLIGKLLFLTVVFVKHDSWLKESVAINRKLPIHQDTPRFLTHFVVTILPHSS